MSPPAILRHAYHRRERWMAEQKIEETKPAVPRRVARPFIGPAGLGSGTRPPLRPAAPTDRPRPASFAPLAPAAPLPQQRPSLGTPPALASAPAVSIAAPVVSLPPVGELPAVEAAAALLAQVPAELPAPAFEAMPEEIVAAPTPVVVAPVRPVTSEMVAIDAIDAFDAVWNSPEVTAQAASAEAASAPIDELSLGGGLDGQAFDATWSERASDDIAMPAWLADDADAAADPVATAEASLSWPEAYATPAEAPVNELAEHTDADDGLWPDPLLAEYAPYIPTPSSVSAIPTPASLRAIPPSSPDALGSAVECAAEDAVEATVEEPVVTPEPANVIECEAVIAAAADPVVHDVAAEPVAPEPIAAETVAAEPVVTKHVSHELRVSAALDRLAERVRSGEIDVSSVVAEAPDAALLASVLAALLGGSSSR